MPRIEQYKPVISAADRERWAKKVAEHAAARSQKKMAELTRATALNQRYREAETFDRTSFFRLPYFDQESQCITQILDRLVTPLDEYRLYEF